MNDAVTLTGTQKVAVVLMNMDQARAADVMKQFTDAEAEEIAAEIIRLRRVDRVVSDGAIREFHELVTAGGRNSHGGKEFAAGLLEASFGSERAASVMNRVASSMAGKAFEFLDTAEPGQLMALLDGELPQTIALVLAHLRPEHASPVLAGLDDSLRTDVAQCIGTMGTATPEAVRMVADTLKVRAGAVVTSRDADAVVGGVQPLVEIINRADVSTEHAVLDGLDSRDPQLAEDVRSRMLTFADLVKLDRRDVQLVLRGIDASVLAMAMKGSPDAVIEVIRANISERNREILEEEIDVLGPVRMRQIEEARAEIVRAVRDLEAEGVITVQRGDDDEYVS
ncbi:MAG TPA: flagellar motor switch protein FliG [Lacisediminihabitans sp.]|uniref:flagellar motor switch protein FliG n=1 Tax=Lacisediminihabitans sp. TaxID=2787631 RepID=UPI002EDA8E24